MTLIIQKPSQGKLVLAKTQVDAGDADAIRYLAAVETADGQALERAVRLAVDTFVISCKADGIWNAIKASCILAGARTLAGALVPLVGTAPTNGGDFFVSADYDRKTGLAGDGSTKYLDSNRNNNVDPQNSKHISAYLSSRGTISQTIMGYTGAVNGNTSWAVNTTTGGHGFRINNLNQTSNFVALSDGFIGAGRSNSTIIDTRAGGSSSTSNSNSAAPVSGNINIFRRTTSPAGTYVNARLAFYSIGESLDLALLDARVTDLITAFGAAIP